MGPHKNLDVWRKSMILCDEIYRVSKSYPKDELFGLVSQMRRAAVSIPSNIAEGYGRSTNAEVIHFLYNSLGSSNELDTQILISKSQNYLTDEDFTKIDNLNGDVNKMLHSLIYKRSQVNTVKP